MVVRSACPVEYPHCLLADNNISNGVKHIRCRTGYKRYRVTCEAINRGMITTIASTVNGCSVNDIGKL